MTELQKQVADSQLTNGLLNFIGSSLQQSTEYTVSQLARISGGPNDAIRETYLAVEKREELHRSIFLLCAVVGAGLACLRESKEY
ncbi:MAG: hypothetical protein ACYTX0_04060 [Nostoc sp.]